MRISLTTTRGVSVSSASSASRAEENVRCAMLSRASAFSNTQRIERSSSTIHTGFTDMADFCKAPVGKLAKSGAATAGCMMELLARDIAGFGYKMFYQKDEDDSWRLQYR